MSAQATETAHVASHVSSASLACFLVTMRAGPQFRLTGRSSKWAYWISYKNHHLPNSANPLCFAARIADQRFRDSSERQAAMRHNISTVNLDGYRPLQKMQ